MLFWKMVYDSVTEDGLRLSVCHFVAKYDIFTSSVHQIAPFMKIFFKKFLGRAHVSPLP